MSKATLEEPLAPQIRRFSPSPNRDPDAGLRALHHYERKLPQWRYRLRQWLIPVVRWETPYLARIQNACRSQFLDSYFALTANLGTHTFFMMFLPVCFWCGYPDFGIALVHMLALGVYLSGALKDLVCLPRPLSPPLQRITMSGSAALEYGFPSTHTTNAVSVAVFGLHLLSQSQHEWSPTTYSLLRLGCYCYATSITLGRMYCGMHGFFDIALGALLGVFIAWIRVICGVGLDLWIIDGSWTHPAIAVAALALAIRFHPEPADNCPCFDDSVAFLGVVMGISIGTWQHARRHEMPKEDPPLAGMFPYTNQNLLKSAARLHGGVVVIFVWRAVMKRFLLRYLPPFFRFVDHWGINMPRRYFLQAKEYTKVPPMRRDDNIIPSASDIPSMLSSFRLPRKRRVSVGPQSEADAREFFANREQQRKSSRPGQSPRRDQERRPLPTDSDSRSSDIDNARSSTSLRVSEHVAKSAIAKNVEGISTASSQTNVRDGKLLVEPLSEIQILQRDDKDEARNDREMVSALEKPRTHYDVEVITKLIVYAGIAWLTVEGNPILFDHVGLS